MSASSSHLLKDNSSQPEMCRQATSNSADNVALNKGRISSTTTPHNTLPPLANPLHRLSQQISKSQKPFSYPECFMPEIRTLNTKSLLQPTRTPRHDTDTDIQLPTCVTANRSLDMPGEYQSYMSSRHRPQKLSFTDSYYNTQPFLCKERGGPINRKRSPKQQTLLERYRTRQKTMLEGSTSDSSSVNINQILASQQKAKETLRQM